MPGALATAEVLFSLKMLKIKPAIMNKARGLTKIFFLIFLPLMVYFQDQKENSCALNRIGHKFHLQTAAKQVKISLATGLIFLSNAPLEQSYLRLLNWKLFFPNIFVQRLYFKYLIGHFHGIITLSALLAESGLVFPLSLETPLQLPQGQLNHI